jgi:hypothetical protein
MADNPEDTGWQKPTDVVGSDEYARGRIELASGIEQRPCQTCKRWEKDTRKTIQHCMSLTTAKTPVRSRLVLLPNGNFETPIARDIPGRKSLQIDPTSYGWCRRDGMLTDMLATCENWAPVISREDLGRRTG